MHTPHQAWRQQLLSCTAPRGANECIHTLLDALFFPFHSKLLSFSQPSIPPFFWTFFPPILFHMHAQTNAALLAGPSFFCNNASKGCSRPGGSGHFFRQGCQAPFFSQTYERL